jgi:carboxypeptidase Taq
MYEQGVSETLDATPLANGTSSGVHESQSRLWENIVGRSFGFWEHYYPELKKVFPKQFERVSLESFYKAINKVSRSLIRTDADELTYNLHVIIRFDLECDLLEGKLAIKDLPEAWRARYRSDLGVFSETDTDGVLQDVHWYSGMIGGAFQGYTLGNILSSQFYDAALKAHPTIPKEITRGKFGTPHAWLRENIYQHGSKFTAPEIIKRATGQEMTIEPYMRYLEGKYRNLYGLE